MRFISFLLLFTLMLNAKYIELNFQNLDINDFIKMVAKITHKNILLTRNLSGKVNFISVKPVNEKEIYSILVNILRSKGYTLIEDNGFLKVVRDYEAIRNAPPLKSDINEFQTDIIKVKYTNINELYNQLIYFRSKYGKIIANKEKNLLIISDYPKNIEIMKKLILQIDKSNQKSTLFYTFKNIESSKIFYKFKQLSQTLYNPKVFHYTIIDNSNENSIIIAGNKEILNNLKQLLIKLDKKPKTLSQQTKIITLKNSDVINISQIISKVIASKYKKNPPSITYDKETNSLILLGSKEQINTISLIIKALDIPKQQVYVKARILEISNLKASLIGSKLGLSGGVLSSSGLYTMSANLGGPSIAIDTTNLGINPNILKQGLALGATLDLLETYGAAKKLSEPSILCINNTPSTIYVGKTISVKTGQTTSSSTSVSFSRQDIGLTLKIRPRIDSDNKVALNIKSIIEDILPGSPDLTLPTTSKREIETTTIVNNGQSIIIGGLVRDNKDITINKVPVLGDIPIIRGLFRHKVVNKDKTTLVILITPYIVKNSSDLDSLRNTLAKLNSVEKSFAKKIIKRVKQWKYSNLKS